MRFNFEKFTETDASFAARATIRQRTGQIGFSAGAINRFSIDKFDSVVLYYDAENRVIGMELTKDSTDGAIEIKRRPSNTYVTAKNFLDKYEIDYSESHRHELKRDEHSGFLYFELASIVEEPEEEAREETENDPLDDL